MILAVGIFVRVFPSTGYKRVGGDEYGYMVFLKQIEQVGLLRYDEMVASYVEAQYKRPDAIVPATRIAFLVPAHVVREALALNPYEALRVTSCVSSILLLFLSAFFAYRLGGAVPMLGVTALMATAPLQIYLAQRAFIDAYFALWATVALWLAWEIVSKPRRWPWIGAYTVSLVILVLTKENAAFFVFALFATLILLRLMKLRAVTPQLLLMTAIGPALAVLFLAWLVGGISDWLQFYLMFVEKSRTNVYSIMAQDGPWYRYLIDFVILSPLVTVCACSRIFQIRKTEKAEIFFAFALAFSFMSMATVTYGMSLRYAAYWELPLCWFAASQLLRVSRSLSSVRPAILAVGLFLVVGSVGLSQYYRFFVEGEVYDPITSSLAQAANLQK